MLEDIRDQAVDLDYSLNVSNLEQEVAAIETLAEVQRVYNAIDAKVSSYIDLRWMARDALANLTIDTHPFDLGEALYTVKEIDALIP